MFRDGQLCVYELMDEDSAVRYWEGYAKIAFDPSKSHIICDDDPENVFFNMMM